MFCPSCGFDNGENVHFCMRCGTKLEQDEPKEENKIENEEANPKKEEATPVKEESISEKEVSKQEEKKSEETTEKNSVEEEKKDVKEEEKDVKEEKKDVQEKKKDSLDEKEETIVPVVPVQTVDTQKEQQATTQQTTVAQQSVATTAATMPQNNREPKKKSGKVGAMIGGAAVVLAVVGGGGYYIYHINTPQYKYDQCIAKAEKLIDEEDYKAAVEKYLAAGEIQKLEDSEKKELYKAYLAIAKSCVEEDNIDEALENFDAARKYAKNKDDVDKQAAPVYLKFAKQSVEKNDVKTALEYLDKAEEYVGNEEEFRTVKAKTCSLLGQEAMQNKKYEEAEEYFDRASYYGMEFSEISICYMELYKIQGQDYAEQKNYYSAVVYYDKASNRGWEGEERAHKYCEAYSALAQNSLANENSEEALTYLSTARYYAMTPEEKELVEQLTEEATKLELVKKYGDSPYPIYMDNNGYPIDLGGMEIIIRDWWSGDPAEPSNDYEEARQEYREWIQETYNFTIKEQAISDWGSVPRDFVNYASTQDDGYNYVFVLRNDPAITGAMANGLMYDLSTLDCLDFSDSKFTKNMLHKQYSYGNRIYAMCAGDPEPGTGMYFNKRVLEDAGVDPESIYELQRTNRWTWDKWIEIMDRVQRDTDGDGVVDIYGTTQNNSNLINAAVFSNGGEYVGKENGHFVYKLENPETVEGLEFAEYILSEYTCPYPDGASWDAYQGLFETGRAAFMPEDGYAGTPGNFLQDMEDDFGFVMFPMGPKMSDYTNCWTDNLSAIPACYNADKAWKIAFAWNLYTNPVPGYEDFQAWKSKYYMGMRDIESVEETVEMMVKKGMVTYDTVILNLQRGADLTWNIYAGAVVSEKIDAIRDTWKAYIEDTNNR